MTAYVSEITALDIRRAAMDLLARREHSFQELHDKLFRKFTTKYYSFKPSGEGGLFDGMSCSAEGSDGISRDKNDLAVLADDSPETEQQQRENLHQLLDQQIEILAAENLQSDERYVESFINGHKAKGQGPLRIRRELEQKSVADHLICEFLKERDELWFDVARETYKKKFGENPIADFQDKAKRLRFLQYRGFSYDLIEALLE